MLNSNQWLALARHVVSYAAGGATVLAGVAATAYNLHILTPDQVSAITNAGKAFVDGVTSLTGAVTTLASVAAAVWGAYSASHTAQAAAVATVPGTTIVTSPSIAAAVPAPNVVSNDANKVVGK